MVNASKILTVSYGTFSCTLEGFDDPFSTMRSIAEYFRDLAADDRYFGAEPPTPDAEMLHRIAARENQRQVEAHVKDNSVILRQVADQPGAEADTVAAEPEVAEAPAPASDVATDTLEDTDEVRVEEYDDVADSVAAKLARIRAAVARSRTEPEPLLNAVFAEDEHAEPEYEDSSIATAFVAEETPVAEVEAEAEAEEESIDATHSDELGLVGLIDETEGTDTLPEAEEVEADENEAAEALEVSDEDDGAEADIDAPAEPEETATADIDNIAATLKLTEFEAEAEDEAVDEAEYEASEEFDETAGFAPSQDDAEVEDKTGEADSDEVADIAAMLDEAVDEHAAEPEYHDSDDTDMPVDLAAVLSSSAETDDVTTDGTDEALEIGGLKDALALDDADMSDESGEDDPQPSGEAETSELLLTESDRADISADDEATGQPHVRVLKMRREEFDAQFVEVEDDAEQASSSPILGDADNIREALGGTGLSMEDEDDLIAELAEVELDGAQATALADVEDAEVIADTTESDDDGIITDDTSDSATEALETLIAKTKGQDAPVAEGDKPAGGSRPEAAVSRLLARTDTALEDSEGSRRRSAIAHLKAAVAAVRADGDQAKNTADAETARAMDQYRNDLASVVRPVPPETTKPQAVPATPTDAASDAPAPGSDRPISRPRRKMPPLMLVSEQRIDKGADPDPLAAPVRPRRVQTRDLDIEAENELFDDEPAEGAENAAGNYFTDAGDFKGYVAETGAEGIQELLEASLAFGLHVEGAKFNSRPQIMMRMLTLFEDGSVTREDGLRAFGVLLREGRIHRVKRGEFLLPETSRFHPGQAPTANSA